MHNQPSKKVRLPGLLVKQGSNNKSGEILIRMINVHVYFSIIYIYIYGYFALWDVMF